MPTQGIPTRAATAPNKARKRSEVPATQAIRPLSGANATGDLEVVVHLEGLIDPVKEKERLDREIARAQKDLQGLQKRFENPSFVARAPPEVVSEGHANMAALGEKLLRLEATVSRLAPRAG